MKLHTQPLFWMRTRFLNDADLTTLENKWTHQLHEYRNLGNHYLPAGITSQMAPFFSNEDSMEITFTEYTELDPRDEFNEEEVEVQEEDEGLDPGHQNEQETDGLITSLNPDHVRLDGIELEEEDEVEQEEEEVQGHDEAQVEEVAYSLVHEFALFSNHRPRSARSSSLTTTTTISTTTTTTTTTAASAAANIHFTSNVNSFTTNHPNTNTANNHTRLDSFSSSMSISSSGYERSEGSHPQNTSEPSFEGDEVTDE